MKKYDLGALLQANPQAAVHEATILKTLNEINDLRRTGFGRGGFTLSPPFGGPARTRVGLRGPMKVRGIARLRSTHDD